MLHGGEADHVEIGPLRPPQRAFVKGGRTCGMRRFRRSFRACMDAVGRAAGQYLVEQHAERIDIGEQADCAARNLFGERRRWET